MYMSWLGCSVQSFPVSFYRLYLCVMFHFTLSVFVFAPTLFPAHLSSIPPSHPEYFRQCFSLIFWWLICLVSFPALLPVFLLSPWFVPVLFCFLSLGFQLFCRIFIACHLFCGIQLYFIKARLLFFYLPVSVTYVWVPFCLSLTLRTTYRLCCILFRWMT